jgi:MSHA pilin protein MshC
MNPFSRPASEHGFTLRELLVMLVIIGILARVLVPKLSLIGTLDAAGYADQTEALLRYAQKTAIAQRRWVAISFNNTQPKICSEQYPIAPNTYPYCDAACSGTNNAIVALPSGNLARVPKSTTKIRSGKGVYAGLAYPTDHPAFSSGGVFCFDAVGRPFFNGTNSPLPAPDSILVQISEVGVTLRTIMIEPETGYVH